jgi:RNA-directed DNA polymerase
VRNEGLWEVIACNSTCDSGEPGLSGTRRREGQVLTIELFLRNMEDALESEIVSTKQKQIAELARKTCGKPIYSLNQFLTIDWMLEAYRRTRKSGAAGIDGVTADEYEKNLNTNLRVLLERMKAGTYQAQPIKRVYVPKSDGSQRPIGIPTLESKIGQRAVLMILECVYEQEFKSFSFGFRPNQSAHKALFQIRKQIMDHRATWIIEADIQKFFDSIDRNRLREILGQRVRDGVIMKLIDKWLKAGVLERDEIQYSSTGTGQGNVLSPLLANIFLHTVLDEWFEQDVQPRLKGRSFLARFCDDFVMGFENEKDARKVLQALSKRFSKFGLDLHPEKTRLVDFRSPPSKIGRTERKQFERRVRKIQTFDFLGFTHLWDKSRKGFWVVFQTTARSRIRKAMKAVKGWCQSNRHRPILEQHEKLSQKLQGHFAYFGITGNNRRVRNFRYKVRAIWFKWLNRRGGKKVMTWKQFEDFLRNHPLPAVRIFHKYEYHAANL